MSDLDRRLAFVARRQRQLITASDVAAVGGAPHHCDRRVAGGRWQRIEPGVFLLAGAPLDWTTRQLAAVLAAGESATTSHLAGARAWGWPGFGRAGLELSLPRGHRYRRPDVRCHESTDLERCRIVRREGLPVTDPDRTLLDIARYVGEQRLTRTVEAARRQGHVTWSSLISTLARHARRGRPGIRRLRAVILANAHREEVTDTDVELLVLGLLTGAGLPEPVLHHRVFEGERFVAEVDMAYPELMVAIECDGDIHLFDEVRERDLPRQNDLILRGWAVLRFSKARVLRRPETIVAEVREARRVALAARRAAS
jgi:hypothetical protein